MTGSTSATSSAAVGAVELREVATRLGSKKEGRERWLSSRGVRRCPWCGRGRAEAATALKGISGDGELGRGRCGGLEPHEHTGLG